MNILKKNKIFPFATTWVDLEGFMLSEIRLTKKDKYYMIPVKFILYWRRRPGNFS